MRKLVILAIFVFTVPSLALAQVPTERSTVKSSKSNSSDRGVASPSGSPSFDRATNLNSSKSNREEKQKADPGPKASTNLNSSRSN